MTGEASQPLSRSRRIAFSCVLLFLSLLFAVILGEVVAHILWPQRETPRWFIQHERYGYFQRKNFEQVYQYQVSDVTWRARFNELGLRGPLYGGPRPGERRVLCIGDSFTFGYGLDEELIFPTRLEKKLNQEGEAWRVINAGVGGWGVLQSTLYARDHFELFKPDVVILTVCDNDPVDDKVFQEGRAGGLLPSFPGKRFLRDHSHLYRYLYRRFANQLLGEVLLKEAPATGPAAASPPVEAAPTADVAEATRVYWARTCEAITRFHGDFMAYNPAGTMFLQQAQPYRKDIRAQIEPLANGTNLFFVDLLPDLEKITFDRLLLPYDPHWTEEVHEASASQLLDLIRAHEGVSGN